jgi:hypothetical protein
MAKAASYKPADLDEKFIKVTETNRKHAVVMGRVMYVFGKEAQGTKFVEQGTFDIRPRMQKGVLVVEKHPLYKPFETYVKNEETMDDYRDGFKSVIDLLVKQGRLYIKKGEATIKYSIKTYK